MRVRWEVSQFKARLGYVARNYPKKKGKERKKMSDSLPNVP
jgi:hypothetical protein